MGNWDQWLVPVLTVIGTIFAGSGLKWIEGMLQRAKNKDDSQAIMRKELREELTALKAEIQQTEKEVDEWKAKYYEVYGRFLMIQNQLDQAKRLLREKAGVELDGPTTLPNIGSE